NCLNGIRRIHTCIPGEKRQNPAHRKGGGGIHGDNICLKLFGMQVYAANLYRLISTELNLI
ncbi:hypothetical protein, partial [Escherichia coli]|uniref:hypothetical protein n=1 Tax=Escherichia coli TaxID=562 RepID=UPI001BD34E8D